MKYETLMQKISSPINLVDGTNNTTMPFLGFSFDRFRFMYELEQIREGEDRPIDSEQRAREITQLFASAGYMLTALIAGARWLRKDPQLAQDIMQCAIDIATDGHPENFCNKSEELQDPTAPIRIAARLRLTTIEYFIFGEEAANRYHDGKDLSEIAKFHGDMLVTSYDPTDESVSDFLARVDGYMGFATITEQEYNELQKLREQYNRIDEA